jgi:hypothetical protein
MKVLEQLVPAQLTLFLQLKSVLKRQGYASTKKSTVKEMTTMTEVSKKWFPGILTKALRTVAKACRRPWELL